MARRHDDAIAPLGFFAGCREIGYVPESRTLDQHNAKHCKRIEHDAARAEIIETLRGKNLR